MQSSLFSHFFLLITVCLVASTALAAPPSCPDPLNANSSHAVLYEDFESLNSWKSYTFKKISRHSEYTLVQNDGATALMASSDASASDLVNSQDIDVYSSPILRWRWKVENIYQKGDATQKRGDDYPLRIYVIFTYDPEQATGFGKIKYAIAKFFSGEYPPHSSLNYIWANQEQGPKIQPNPYTDQAQMIALRRGTTEIGKWKEECVDIVEDYRKAFGEDPPRRARLAVMNDSDNTEESSVSYLDFMEVHPRNNP